MYATIKLGAGDVYDFVQLKFFFLFINSRFAILYSFSNGVQINKQKLYGFILLKPGRFLRFIKRAIEF